MDHLTKQQCIRIQEGNLSKEEEQFAEEHLNNCPDCVAAMEEIGDERRIAWARRVPKPPCISDYQDFEFVGRGGFGVVFRAQNRKLNRIDALKMLRPNRKGLKDSEGLQKEALKLAALEHENIVRVYELKEYDSQPVLVLEYCEGKNLSAIIENQPQDPREAAPQIKTLAEAIEVVHQMGIVHRDLKPAN